MEIRRIIDGKEHFISLSDNEIEQAFRIREHEYLSKDVEIQLEELGSVRSFPAELFQNQEFYDAVICRTEKMDGHNEDIQYAIEDVVDHLTHEEISQYIKPNLIKVCEQMKNMVYVSCESVKWYYYNPDAYSGGQIVYHSCDLNYVEQALQMPDSINRIISASYTELYDINTTEFVNWAMELMHKEPTFIASDDELLSKLIEHTENYSIFYIKINDFDFYYKDRNTDVANLLQRYADCGNVIPKMLTEDCRQLDEYEYAHILQCEPHNMIFAAEINVDTNKLRILKEHDYHSENLSMTIAELKKTEQKNECSPQKQAITFKPKGRR